MQIHELNNFTGTLGSGAYLAIDDGTDTGKISSQGLLAATEARIDNIIAGPAPSAEEIVDARLGADGVTYPSLGDAIRDQFTDVKADNNQSLYGKSILAKDINDFKSTTLYKVDGTTTTLSNRYSTDFIDVSNIYLIEYGAKGLTNPRLALVAFFDENQVYLSSSLESFSTSNIEGKIYVPSNAKYVRVITQSGVNAKSYVYGYLKGSLKQGLREDSEEVGLNVNSTYDLAPIFNDGTSYLTDGTITRLSNRYTSEYIKCDTFDYIEYGLSGLTGENHLNVISFFDDKLAYVSGVSSTKSGFETGIAKVPSGAVYVKGNKLSSSTADHYMRGCKSASIDRRLTTVELLTGKSSDAVTSIVTPDMSIADFRDAYNAELSNFAALVGCTSNTSFASITVADTTWDAVYSRINRTFRSEVCVSGMPHDVVCDRVNHAFAENIWMWKDAKYNDGTPRDFSLAFPERSGEPSAIVSPDGGSLYVYAYSTRWASTDGLHWTKDSLTRTGAPSDGVPEHANTNYIDGIYYMLGRLNNGNHDLALFTSTDGLNFEYKGVVLEKTDISVDGETVYEWGNSYIVKDADTYYLYIEAKLTNNANFWDIYLCTCTDPLLDNGDGTVGNWNYSGTGALVGDLFVSSNLRAHGNPDFAKDPDNRPIRVNGYWYMYYHVTYNGAMYIYRAKSNDLKTWTVEGYIINNRDVPTAGENSAGNADHALIEFKGKTYLFYTWDINSQYTPYIKYVVDDRPFRELLKMYP